jgi:hypothetical protein
MERSRTPFTPIKSHVLLPFASNLTEADTLLKARLTPTVLQDIVNMIPDPWLDNDPLFANHDEHRAGYLAYLLDRLAASYIFVEEALHARAQLL